MTASRSGGGGSSRVVLGVLLFVLVLFVIGWLSNNSTASDDFNPVSTKPNGTKAFVDTIEHFGTHVEVPDHFPDDADIAVMFVDAVPPSRLDQVRAWVRAGHTLVVTAGESELAPPGAVGPGPHVAGQQIITSNECTIDALRGIGTLDRGPAGSFFDEFQVPPGAASCFGDGATAFITSQAVGRGRIVSIAGGGLFQNVNLANVDNAGLATAIFAPHPGLKVSVVTDAAFAAADDQGGGADTAMSVQHIITFGVGLAILQLGVGVIVYGFSRGRRLGRPVLEPQPVQIAGSELVNAVGNLLQQMKQPGNASAILRTDLRHQLCARIGLPFDASPDLIAATVAAQTSIDHDTVLRAVADYPVAGDAELVELAHQIDAIRKEVLHEHAT